MNGKYIEFREFNAFWFWAIIGSFEYTICGSRKTAVYKIFKKDGRLVCTKQNMWHFKKYIWEGDCSVTEALVAQEWGP